MSKKVGFLYILLLIYILFNLFAYFKFKGDIKQIEESNRDYTESIKIRKQLIRTLDSLNLENEELLKSLSELEIEKLGATEDPPKPVDPPSLPNPQPAPEPEPEPQPEPEPKPEPEPEPKTDDKTIIFTGISEVFAKDKFDKQIPIRTEHLYIRLNSKSKTDDVTKSINSIILNKKKLNVLDYEMDVITTEKNTKVYSYLIKLEIKEKTLLPGINQMILTSGIVRYVKQFIAR